MERIASADGTPLAVERSGSGPPLVCIHGTSATRSTWDEFAAELAGMECVRYDRRGRGDSGDADEYSLAREVEDARAVVERVGDPESVAAFGHSFGAIVAFHLARETPLHRLVLYEPPVLAGDHGDREPGFADRLRQVLDEEGPEAAVRTFRGMPADAPLEPEARDGDALARMVVREVAVAESFDRPATVDVATPTRCLVGGDTGAMLRESTLAVQEALPNADLVTIEGHGHNAIGVAPERVTECLDDFLP